MPSLHRKGPQYNRYCHGCSKRVPKRIDVYAIAPGLQAMLNDPWIAGATFIVLLLVSAIADFIPEHRASWIDPNPALR
jgi:hypothetical protein